MTDGKYDMNCRSSSHFQDNSLHFIQYRNIIMGIYDVWTDKNMIIPNRYRWYIALLLQRMTLAWIAV